VIGRIVVLHLQRLSDAPREDARRVLAVLLTENDRRGGHRRRREGAVEVHEHVGKRAIRSDDEGL